MKLRGFDFKKRDQLALLVVQVGASNRTQEHDRCQCARDEDDQLRRCSCTHRCDDGGHERGKRDGPEKEEARSDELADREKDSGDRPDHPTRHAALIVGQRGRARPSAAGSPYKSMSRSSTS